MNSIVNIKNLFNKSYSVFLNMNFTKYMIKMRIIRQI